MGTRGGRIHASSFPSSGITNARRYGDLKFLGLSLGIFLLCALGLIWTLDRPNIPAAPAALATKDSSSVNRNSEGQAERLPLDVQECSSPHRDDATKAREEQERALRDMAEQTPPDEIIIY